MNHNTKPKPSNMSKSSNQLSYQGMQMSDFNTGVQRKYSYMFPTVNTQFQPNMYNANQYYTPLVQPTQHYKVMSLKENDAYMPQKLSCLFEINASYPENSKPFWNDISNAFGVSQISSTVNFSKEIYIMHSQIPLECMMNNFIMTILYKIGSDEIRELICSISLTDSKVQLGNNTLVFKNDNDNFTLSFSYLGYFKPEQVHKLVDIKFVLFSKSKLKKTPTNRPFSMDSNLYPHNVLLANQKVCF